MKKRTTGNEEILEGLLTVHSRTAFSAGLYDILNTGNLEPLEREIKKKEKLGKRHEDSRKKGITPTPHFSNLHIYTHHFYDGE